MKKVIIIIICIITVLIATFFSYFLLINKDTETYKNKEVEIKFQYPESFGNVMEKVWKDSSSDDVIASGKALEISFENNRDIGLVVASKDFKTYVIYYFNGDKKLTDLCPVTSVDERGNGCTIRKIGSREVLEQTKYTSGEDMFNLIHTYSMPWSGKSGYSGLELIQWFPGIYNKMTQDEKENEKITKEYAQKIIFQKDRESLEKQIKDAEIIISSLTEI